MLTLARPFVAIVTIVVQVVRALARSRADLVLENLALRQQLGTLKRKRPRPRLDDTDRGFWVALVHESPLTGGSHRATLISWKRARI